MSETTYRFGAVEVRPAERQILVEGQAAAVGARAFDLLLALIGHRDRVVTKNELLDLVWPGLVVEENNLQVQVSALRKLLGNQSIATLPGRGYRFTLPLDGDQPAGPACPLPGLRHNLPAQLNSFVGRERELALLKEALVNARLVTLTGVGGTGKSRLSLQVASELTGDYPAGVWLVELAPLADEQRVAQAVAFVLGVKEETGRPVIEALVGYVRDKRLLLVLDNCEHLIAACADLARRLLLAGPSIKILASSREPLHVTGETRFPVPALALATEAVRLFVDRAVAVQPSFQSTPQNAAAIAAVCQRLDGIPLAIELAAARVGALTVERIAVLLDDCFRVLSQGDRAAATRQQTLRASLDWSYDLLTIPERILLRRLSVFAGGWTLEAAEAIVAEGDLGRDDVLDLLTQLVEKSLVEIDARGERYRLLQTVRQYALELLEASGELQAVQARHVLHFVETAERTRHEILGARAGVAFAALDADLENLLAAHAKCDRLPDGAALGLRLSRALRHYWIRRGRLALGLRVALDALQRLSPAQRTTERSRALFDAGQLHCFAGQFAQAKRFLEESVAIARELRDPQRIGYALQPLGMACLGLGRSEEARACLQESAQIASERGDVNEMAAAFNALAQLHRTLGELDASEALYQKAMTLASQTGNNETIAITLLNLAMLWIDRRSAPRARAMLLQVLEVMELTGSKANAQSVLEVSSGLAVLLEEWEIATRFYGAAEAMAEETGIHRDPADEAFLAPRVDEARRRLPPADFDEAEAAGRALPFALAMQEARAWLQSPTRCPP